MTPMTPARKRIELANQLEAERNARAIAESRVACLPAAVERLVPVLIDGHEFLIRETS